MNKDIIIEGLFPTPIYLTELNKKLSLSEKKFIKDLSKKTYKNEGNIVSIDNYVLNKPPLNNLKKVIEKNIDIYFEKIYAPLDKIKPFITQSWINFTSENQFHHTHEHPNSLISGVYYIDADENLDSIKFFKSPRYQPIKFRSHTFNHFNSDTWIYPVKTGKLIMFPSSTTHSVDNKKGSNIRTSLAFNVFFKGTVGDNRALTELKI
jgi:uncharacterized protein (TIGR02466 family)